ncbi:MAG: hypothetical protein AB7I32_03490 [Gammaproteobacteria bacterium]
MAAEAEFVPGPRPHGSVLRTLGGEGIEREHAANVTFGGVGATGGDVHALTANLAWEPVPFLLLRPELEYDVYGGGSLFAVARKGIAREDAQLLGVLNVEFKFRAVAVKETGSVLDTGSHPAAVRTLQHRRSMKFPRCPSSHSL